MGVGKGVYSILTPPAASRGLGSVAKAGLAAQGLEKVINILRQAM